MHFGYRIVLCVLSLLIVQARPASSQNFRVHKLATDSEFSAATAFDINGDSANDIICGAFFYPGPGFQERHQFRDVEVIRGRFDDYSNLSQDVDADGDLDIISVNYRSKSLYWCENPSTAAMASNPERLWEKHVIDMPGSSETGRLIDVDGDGQKDILPSGTSFAAWYRKLSTEQGEPPKWKRVDLPAEMIGHGIGAGDINGDGRIDIVSPNGWATPAGDDVEGRWVWQGDFKLARDCGLPIEVRDVDQDGDADLVWSRGHNYGIYWTEQITADDIEAPERGGEYWEAVNPLLSTPGWVTHAIDTSWSCAHTLMFADLNGDGREELIAAKRFQGHDGRDPGENAPLRIVAYDFQIETRAWKSSVLSHDGDVGVDLDSVCSDLDGDGDIDILAPTRGGLSWLENVGSQSIAATPGQSAERIEYEPTLFRIDGVHQVASDALVMGQQQDRFRAGFEKLAGKLPGAEHRTPLGFAVQYVEKAGRYWRLHVTFAGSEKMRVPAWLLIPLDIDKPVHAMLCLHPTQFELGKSQICGLGGKPSRFYAHELAEQGFICLAPDYPGFGEYACDFQATASFRSGTMRAIWDNIRAVDLLESLPCVDRDAIGVIGHSLGGHNALFTAMFDGRIRSVVTSCGFTAMPHYKGGDLTGWTSSRYMPAIADYANAEKLPVDFPEILAAIAPAAVFVSAPIEDDNFDVAGVKRCEAAAKTVYDLLDKSDRIEFQYPSAGHDFPEPIRKRAYAWLEKHL